MKSRIGEKRWTRATYHQAAEREQFALSKRLELLNGRIWVKPKQSPGHFSTREAVSRRLEAAFGAGFTVRKQGPIVLNDRSEPEPDIAVVAGTKQDFVSRHPRVNELRLLVEVSDTTLAFDRTDKAAVYARAQIAEYWILNINARTLLVHCNPQVTNERTGRWGYQSVVTLTTDETVTPLALIALVPPADGAGAAMGVAELFPLAAPAAP